MPSESRHLIIGGGVIGLCSAYFLARSGVEVIVVDRDSPSRKESCSDQNAGMVVPSHFIPLAAPGVISQGLRWMLNKRSPFYLRPRLDPKLWSWCLQFVKHSNRRHVENSKELLRDISLESRSLMTKLSTELEFPMVKKGLVMLCQSESGLEEEKEVASMANEIGITAEVCGSGRLRELDPDIAIEAMGGVWFPDDCHLDSERFLASLRRGITELGGSFLDDEVVDLQVESSSITHAIAASGNELHSDHFTLAGGAWSPALASKLGLHLPMQGGKGYSFTLKNPEQLPELCYLLKEGRVAVTPMGKNLRVAGTMEICGNDLSIDPIRLEGITEAFCRFFPQFGQAAFEGIEPWAGLRPCSPDGLPYIGRVPGLSNAIVATGHSMLGLSLGAVTGRMVASINEGDSADRRLRADRF